jgi:L-ascorbate metabolism protein UlaG (beta-lactamase superfamily)
VILITHAHADHIGDTVPIAQRTNAPVIAIVEIANWLRTQGVENVIEGNFGATIAFPNGTGSAKFVPAWHTSTYATQDGVEAISIPAGFIIRFGGRTMYYAGDTGLFGDMALIGEEGIDIAFLPIGDKFTMGPADAARAAALVKAPSVFPMHYNTFPAIQQDPHEFARLVHDRTNGASSVQVLYPGVSVEV